MKWDVTTFGIPRSGTVYLWQILNHFYPDKVLKLHEYQDIMGPLVIIYRDFRDVFCSYCQAIIGRPFAEIPIGVLEQEVEFIRKGIEYLNHFRAYRQDAMFIRYEDVVVIDDVADYLDLEISHSERDEMYRLYSLGENNKISIRRAASGKTFPDGHDDKSLIHAHHISGVEWENYRPWVEHYFTQDLLDWGYELTK